MCVCVFSAQEDISLWQELSWKSCFLTSVIGTYARQRHCHSKREGVEFNGDSRLQGARRLATELDVIHKGSLSSRVFVTAGAPEGGGGGSSGGRYSEKGW